MSSSFALETGTSRALLEALAAGWTRSVTSGIVSYDPETTERFVLPPFCFHFLPQRASRPRADDGAPPHPDGVRRAHESCLFDTAEFVRARELAWLERESRRYVVVANRFPVRSRHLLAARPVDEPGGRLSQCLYGPEELEDAFFLVLALAPEYRVYFNSNRGADGSFSGSSVNHWHLQLFPPFDGSPSTLVSGPVRVVGEERGVTTGSSPEWPGRNVFVECTRATIREGAARLWELVAACNECNCAYNLEALPLAGERLRTYLFPRRPAAPIEIPGIGAWSPNMGGCELEGHIVVPTRELFEWVRRCPERADAVTRTRLIATTWSPLPQQ